MCIRMYVCLYVCRSYMYMYITLGQADFFALVKKYPSLGQRLASVCAVCIERVMQSGTFKGKRDLIQRQKRPNSKAKRPSTE